MKELYQTGLLNNTNVAVEGGNDKTTIRFSYTKASQTELFLPINLTGIVLPCVLHKRLES
jgi:hypothetical protein